MKRKINVLIALISALALITSGTFAWEQIITQVNEFTGGRGETGITLHDDFNPGINKKDVYVENTGDMTLLVRVKLNEAMSLISSTWRPSGGEWVTHRHAAADCAGANAAGKKFHDHFEWTMGGWKYYMPASGRVVNDLTVYSGTEPGVKKTPDARIVSAADFLAMTGEQQEAFNGWIFSADGYAYWSRLLKGGEATGLLLGGVKPKSSLKNIEYYYAIDVIVEAVDEDDLPMWTQGAGPKDPGGTKHPEATTDGKEVINIIIGGDGGNGAGTGGNGNGNGNGGGGNGGGGNGEIPVNKPGGGFTPITDPDPMKGDGYYASIDFVEYDDPEKNELYHYGSIHLEDIITDGNYSVTAEAVDDKYKPYITIGDCDRHGGKPSIIYSYEPTADEWMQTRIIGGDQNMTIPVQVRLTRDGGETAVITVNMIYPLCLVTIS
ncbi:MAG: hypothetical protein FWH06_00155 [Oscillospiraceae bacterium]|nr:hypothetical protein [Oscillospiraceae bacterium]